MSTHLIRRAVKGKQKLRLGLIGPTGSGKTWTALEFARELVAGTDLRVGVIDTERESSELYADRFDFDVIQLTESHNPQEYIDALKAYADTGEYGCVVVDSLSHAWMGRDGALEMVDKAGARSRSGNKYIAWGSVTPLQNQMVDALLAAPYHLIVTLRAKMEYVQEKDEKGNTTVRKIGLQPVQRDGMEYEFTVVCDIDTDHRLVVGKTRCSLVDGKVLDKPGASFARTLRTWIESGVDKPPAPPKAPEPEPEGDVEVPTFDQLQLIEKLQKSHVFNDGERAKLKRARETQNTKARASAQIEWLMAQLKERKAQEKASVAPHEPPEDSPEVAEAMQEVLANV